MAEYRAVIEWQNAGDTHWFTSGVVRLTFDADTLAAVREIVPAPQGFPTSGLSAVASAEADSAIRSTATLMTVDEVRSAHEAYQAKHGSPSHDLRVVLRMMEEYTNRGVATRFIFWEAIVT